MYDSFSYRVIYNMAYRQIGKPKTMKSRLLSILSSGLAVFFLIMWITKGCDKPTEKPQDEILWRERVEQREAVIREKDSIIATITKDREIQARKHDSVSSSLKQRELALIRKLKEANADIQVIADSLPKVARYIELADSTIATKDSIYHRELNHRFMMEKSYQFEIAQLGDKHVKQVEISKVLETKVIDLQNDNDKLERKLERKKRGNRLLGGIAAGMAAAIAVITLSQ